MIRIGILDLSEHSDEKIISLAERLGDMLDIEKKNNPKANAQSIFARLLLTEVYKNIVEKPLPRIIKSEKGKPYFLFKDKNADLFFSISHDGNMVAVAISDAGEVGIDLQSIGENMRSRERIERTLSTLFCGVDSRMSCEVSDDTELKIYRLSADTESIYLDFVSADRIINPSGVLAERDADFLRSWTRLESLLKLSGGGFADTGEILKTSRKARSQSIFLKSNKGRAYSLTVSDYFK